VSRESVALLTLTFVTGIVDAVSYLALGHVLTANMTGNVVFLGFAVAGAPGLSAARCGMSLAAFVAGAIVSGRLAGAMALRRRPWLYAAAGCEAMLLGLAALLSLSEAKTYTMIAVTAFAMGFRTGTIRRLAVPDLSTTALTTTLAAVAPDSFIAGGPDRMPGRRGGAIVCMFAGAAAGALLLCAGVALPLLVGAALSLAATLYGVGRRPPRVGAAC
jgi:uncharacterized membrane protein YoaK (UPF0700 family)